MPDAAVDAELAADGAMDAEPAADAALDAAPQPDAAVVDAAVPDCEPEQLEDRACGLNDRGVQSRGCLDGAWANWDA